MIAFNLKVLITVAADDSFSFFFSEKIRFDISYFLWNNEKKKKNRISSAILLLSSLKISINNILILHAQTVKDLTRLLAGLGLLCFAYDIKRVSYDFIHIGMVIIFSSSSTPALQYAIYKFQFCKILQHFWLYVNKSYMKIFYFAAENWFSCISHEKGLVFSLLSLIHSYLSQPVQKKAIIIFYFFLTLKMPRKPASENIVCFCRLLNILANFSNLFLNTGKQYGPRSDCS